MDVTAEDVRLIIRENKTKYLKKQLMGYAEGHLWASGVHRDKWNFINEMMVNYKGVHTNITPEQLDEVMGPVLEQLVKNSCLQCLEIKEQIQTKYEQVVQDAA